MTLPTVREIIRRIVFAISPVETEPVDVLAYRVDILHVFLHRALAK